MLSGAEDCRRPIPMVDVAIDRHRPLDLAVLLHPADGHCYIVDYAESLAVVREGMMKPAAYVESDAVLQSELRRLDRASSRQPERPDQLRRVGDLHLRLFKRRQRPIL